MFKMNIAYFVTLSELEKIEAYWQGNLVGSYMKDGKEFECRQINDFYVECRIEDDLFYRDMKCHNNRILLKPFLNNQTLDNDRK